MQGNDSADVTLAGLIAQMDPPQAPEAVSLWPQTPVAQGITAALALLCLILLLRWMRRYRANAYRRAALAELQTAEDDPARIAEILRRTALAAFPRSHVASLRGAHWLEFLNGHYPGSAFTGDVGRILLAAPYIPPVRGADKLPALTRTACDWVRQHTAEASSS